MAVVAFAFQVAGAQEITGKVSLSTVSLKVTILKDDKNSPILREEFTTTDPYEHSVFCMSGFFDVQYTLRNSSGQIIPVNKEPWKYGSDRISGGGGIPSAARGPVQLEDPCKEVKAPLDDRQFPLSYLYPNLEPGFYTLQLTLAPSGTSERAAMVPFVISVP